MYWATGNPGNDLVGDERGGDNLYSRSILALDAKSGKLRWYYQFKPRLRGFREALGRVERRRRIHGRYGAP